MIYLFHEKLITSSTKNPHSQKIQKNKSASKRTSLAKSRFFLFFLSEWHHIFLAANPRHIYFFVTFFVNLLPLLSWVTCILNDPILLSYHDIFSNKSVLFGSNHRFAYNKDFSRKGFWIIPSKISTVQFFLCTTVDLPVSFPKICLEQLFCKELFSGTCH